MTRRRWVYVDGVAHEVGAQEPSDVHIVMPDLAAFKASDGAHIEGRAQWRRHLKANDLQEYGHSDMKHMAEMRKRKQEAFKRRLNNPLGQNNHGGVRETTVRDDWQPAERGRLQVEMLNRLHGKPVPPRKELIKMSLDLAKRMKGYTRG